MNNLRLIGYSQFHDRIGELYLTSAQFQAKTFPGEGEILEYSRGVKKLVGYVAGQLDSNIRGMSESKRRAA